VSVLRRHVPASQVNRGEMMPIADLDGIQIAGSSRSARHTAHYGSRNSDHCLVRPVFRRTRGGRIPNGPVCTKIRSGITRARSRRAAPKLLNLGDFVGTHDDLILPKLAF
jgi:hypothetical protein